MTQSTHLASLFSHLAGRKTEARELGCADIPFVPAPEGDVIAEARALARNHGLTIDVVTAETAESRIMSADVRVCIEQDQTVSFRFAR